MRLPVFALAATLSSALLGATAARAEAPRGGALEGGDISVGERVPLVMLIFTGKTKGVLQTHLSEIFQIAADVLRERTDLALLSPEQALADPSKVAACGEKNRFTCWVKAVRNDYDRGKLLLDNGEFLPFDEHRRDMKSRGQVYSQYLLVLGIHPQSEQTDRVTAVLLNTDKALARWHDDRRKEGAWEEQVEDDIFEHGAQASPESVHVSNAAELKVYFEKLFLETFKAEFERGGHWDPYGHLQIESPVSLLIELDGKSVGQTRPGTSKVRDVKPGLRKLALEDVSRKFERYTTEVEVKRGETALVTPSLVERPSDDGLRRLTFWSGVGVATLGAIVTAYAVFSTPASTYLRPCSPGVDDCDGTPPASFASFCDLQDGGPSCIENGKGVLVAPLGYSLVATGGAWAVGSEIFDQELELPWRSIVAGVVLGAAAYGLSVALDGGVR